jgi:hypothetical protein
VIVFGLINRKRLSQKGGLFLYYFVLASASMLFLEAYRGDSQMVGDIRLVKLAAWFCLAVGLWLLGERMFSNKKKDVNGSRSPKSIIRSALALPRRYYLKIPLGLPVVPKRSQHRRGCHSRILLPAAHHCTQVQSFHNHSNTFRVRGSHSTNQQFAGQAFLDLQTPGK